MVGGKRLAIIARMDDSGLGHQTRNLVRALKPDKVIAIDFSFYNQFKQYPEWYKEYDTKYINGFIQDQDVHDLMKDVDIVLTAETFYNNNFIEIANRAAVTTISQVNYEFFDPLANRSLLIPSIILMPSYWHLNDMKQMAGPGRVDYLPPPTFTDDYKSIREENFNRTGKRRFLHVAGKMAANDRAGTKDLLEALKHSRGDFELVIKVQSGEMLEVHDERVKLDYSFPEDERDLYKDFDAMIHPRRYAGLNLPMNEALAAGLPVMMTNISPNNQVLPSQWLVPCFQMGAFTARTSIELHSAQPMPMGAYIDQFAAMSDDELKQNKEEAYRIALREFSVEKFQERWGLLMEKLGV